MVSRPLRPKRVLPAILAGWLTALSASADNLVPNYSFETGACPKKIPTNLPSSWTNPNATPTFYFKACGAYHSSYTPYNFAGYQVARTGVAYVLAGIGDKENPAPYGAYVMAQLAEALVAEQTYCVEAHVSLTENSEAHVLPGAFGVELTDTPLTLPFVRPFYGVSPEATNAAALTNSVAWTKIANSIQAIGGERYVTVGPFPESILNPGFTPTGGTDAFYYVDDVAVTGPPTAAFSLPATANEDEPIPFDGSASSDGMRFWAVQVSRVGEPCGPTTCFGRLFFSGPPGLLDLQEAIADNSGSFVFDGSPTGIDYDVRLVGGNACLFSNEVIHTITVFGAPTCDQLIDFEDIPNGSGVVPVPSPRSYGDYEVDAAGPMASFQLPSPAWPGSKAVHSDVSGGGVELSLRRTDGGRFDVCSMSLAEGISGATSATFSVPGLIQETVVLNGVLHDQEYVEFPSMRRIQELRSIGYSDVQWDDVCLCDEPPRCWQATGLRGWWSAENCNALDRVNTNDGSVEGQISCVGNAATDDVAFGFDGVSRIRVPHDATLDLGSGSLSLSTWVRTTTSSQTAVLVEKGGPPPAAGFRLELVNGWVGFSACDGTSCQSGLSATSVADGAWHHVVGELERGGIDWARVYVDGFEVGGSGGSGLGSARSTADLILGGLTSGFVGELDEVAIHSTAVGQAGAVAAFQAENEGICDDIHKGIVVIGVASGGQIEVSSGDYRTGAGTLLGETAADVAANLVAQINADDLFSVGGVTAIADGNRVTIDDPYGIFHFVSTDDPGLTLEQTFAPMPPTPPPTVDVPIVGPVGWLALGASIFGVAARGLRRARRDPRELSDHLRQ